MKIWVRLSAAILIMLVATWSVMLVWQDYSNPQSAVNQARESAVSIRDLTLAGLTGMPSAASIGAIDTIAFPSCCV